MEAFKVYVFPRLRVLLRTFSFSEDTGVFTVIVHFAAFLEPSLAVAVMIAVPFPHAVTLPLADTVATFVLLDIHNKSVLLAVDGDTVADK